MAQRIGRPSKRPAPAGDGAPAIPFEFDPPGSDFESDHLTTQDVDGGQRITWPLIGKSFFLPDRGGKPAGVKFYVDLRTIEQTNPQLAIHRLGGFSLGDYHEFFMHGVPAHRAYRFGSVEASFGEGSPLLARLFWGVFYEKYWGEWSTNASLRITNCSLETVERYVIAAFLEYKKEIGFLPGIQQIDFGQLEFGEELDTEAEGRGVVRAPPVVTDIEPLRFYMAGLNSDDEAACLSFYRVLEYYAFMQQAVQVTTLRRDPTVSDADFTRRTLEIASREEKGPIFKLLGEITTPDILQAAVNGGVVKEARQTLINEALYAYRNSIVHGKFGSAFTLRSQSVLAPDAEAGVWRGLLQDLAWAALQNLGSKA
ncbi:MAG TPA: hypothetical protein VIP08_09380 [Phenylobacterium sp.]|uniref:hypothetical protein n=1 Tax=Phenylobacterium sp. TaxID=1871053 RepID=UPI002F950244